MTAPDVKVKFDVPASLRKWPSHRNKRITNTVHAGPYLLLDGTLDECIKEFPAKPASQHHLYEIHTAPQRQLISAVLSAEHTIELARLREFLVDK
jgi:hypothetical protein